MSTPEVGTMFWPLRQGSEKNVLKSAFEFLKKTHLVICEVDIDDFEDINTVLVQNNFVL
jgi:hypothetical protein